MGEQYYVVCDSSWDILRLDERLPLLSSKNEVLSPDPASFSIPAGEDSGFEVIMHDASSPADFYVFRESIKNDKDTYDAHILKVQLNATGLPVARLRDEPRVLRGGARRAVSDRSTPRRPAATI